MLASVVAFTTLTATLAPADAPAASAIADEVTALVAESVIALPPEVETEALSPTCTVETLVTVVTAAEASPDDDSTLGTAPVPLALAVADEVSIIAPADWTFAVPTMSIEA